MKLSFTLFNKFFLTCLVLLSSVAAFAQTKVSGVVTDAKTKQPMPYVTVTFAGTTIGAGTNADGRYTITTTQDVKQIQVSFVGFRTAVRNITPNQEQTINVALSEDNRRLSEVMVRSGKKKKYSNKK